MHNSFATISEKMKIRFRRNCRGAGIHWRKLILAICVFTTVGALLQTCTVPHPLTNWFFSPLVSISPYTIQSKESSSPHQRQESFLLNGVASINPVNSLATHVPVPNLDDTSDGYKEGLIREVKRPISMIEEKLNTSKMETPVIKTSPVGNMNTSSLSHRDTPISSLTPDQEIMFPKEITKKLNASKIETPAVKTSPAGRMNSSNRERPISPLTPEEELMFAKKEIADTPMIFDEPDLYSPAFRNVSIFKRSYEVMERILKVFIYQDGRAPIFHSPHLKGIYASEGWFMKLMKENKQFVVRDPNKAHLFYLPYSARQLQHALYVPDSHNMRPLSVFLKDYVNLISAKYPFWNRTRGSDHFLVACHDWGPYTLIQHDELLRNTIKALCNADVSEGIFRAGKDVSLPETSIRTPKRPLRNVGGNPVSKRNILSFFAGNMHGRVRPILLKHWGDKDPDMRIFGPLPNRIAKKLSYIQHMKSSKFCICPMGYEVNSPRIVEAIYYECVPVIIADNFVPPFNEVLDWSKFSVIVAEKDIPRLKEILEEISLRQYIAMHTAVKQVQKHFLWHYKPMKYDIFHMILHSIWLSRLDRIQIPNE